jgi:hypothetical protein
MRVGATGFKLEDIELAFWTVRPDETSKDDDWQLPRAARDTLKTRVSHPAHERPRLRHACGMGSARGDMDGMALRR